MHQNLFPRGLSMSCQVKVRRKIQLSYEGLKDFYIRCGRLGHSRDCLLNPNPRLEMDGLNYDDGMWAPPISKRSTFLFKPKMSSELTGVFEQNHWRHRLEKEDGDLFVFSDEDCNRKSNGPDSVNLPINETTDTSALSQKTGSMLRVSLAMSHTYASSQFASVVLGTNIAANPKNGATQSRYISMWDPESVGTHYRNGYLRLAIGGLSLNHNWFDPDTIPLWT